MDIAFKKFLTEELKTQVFSDEIVSAHCNILSGNMPTQPRVLEIMILCEIWKNTPLRGKVFYKKECHFVNEYIFYMFNIRPRLSYVEYIVKLEKDMLYNSKYFQDTREYFCKVYHDELISEEEYLRLSDDDYIKLVGLKFRMLTPCEHFIEQMIDDFHENNISMEEYHTLQKKLRIKWNDLPEKGKLDY
jgi:hypothetical protein